MSTIVLHHEGGELSFDGDVLIQNWKLNVEGQSYLLSIFNEAKKNTYIVKVAPVDAAGNEGSWKAQIFKTADDAADYLRNSGLGQTAVDAAEDLLLLA